VFFSTRADSEGPAIEVETNKEGQAGPRIIDYWGRADDLLHQGRSPGSQVCD